jgi:hypothetical protein
MPAVVVRLPARILIAARRDIPSAHIVAQLIQNLG